MRGYSLSAKKNWESRERNSEKCVKWTAEDVFKMVKKQVEILVHDPFFSMTRKFLTIEQFHNPQLAAIKNKSEYIDALDFHKELVQYLIDTDTFVDGDIEIVSHEFFSTIYVQFYRMQREPDSEKEAMKIIERHIEHIFKIYGR